MPPGTPAPQRIPYEIVGSLKTNISLLSLLRRYGIEAKKKGKGYKAICPFHDVDGRPEMLPSKLSSHSVPN